MRITRRRVIATTVVALGAASLVGWRWAAEWLFLAGIGAKATITLPPSDSVVVPIRLVRNLIKVPARLGERDLALILDSGLQFSVLNADRSAELGITLHGVRKVPSGGSQIDIAFAEPATIAIGPARFRPRRLPAMSLSFLEPFIGERIDGIVGHDLLSATVSRVSYSDRTLTLWDSARAPSGGSAGAIPVVIKQREAFVDVGLLSLDGAAVTTRLKIDTGSPTALGLDGGLVSTARLLPAERARRTVPGLGLRGETKGEAFLLRSASLSTHRFDTLLAYQSLEDSSSRGGVLGAELLRHFTVTFDYPRLRLWLEPSFQRPPVLQYDRSGLTLVAQPGTFDTIKVHFVEPGSPGAAAGIMAGDQIVTIGDTDARDARLSGVVAGLSRGGEVAHLTLRRDAKERVVLLQLPKHYPEP